LSVIRPSGWTVDTLTVNQKDQAEVISTVQSIPSIFRDAVRTIVIRESDGIYQCCEKAVDGFQDWNDFLKSWLITIRSTTKMCVKSRIYNDFGRYKSAYYHTPYNS
jgi:hypothetical protein